MRLIPHKQDTAVIRRLIERFLDGDTTPSQERQIYRYYSTHADLPGDLERYRAMFAWYSGMAPATKRHPWRRFAVAAAALALLIATGITVFVSHNSAEERLYASYQGSYIIRNGQRIDDISQIYTRLTIAEQLADSLTDYADRQARRIEEIGDGIIIDDILADIDDPQLAEEIRKEIFE